MTSHRTTTDSIEPINVEPHVASTTLAPFIDEKHLCAELGISSVTATKWRAKAEGPPFIKVGRLVRYRRTDLESWLDSRTMGRRSARSTRKPQE